MANLQKGEDANDQEYHSSSDHACRSYVRSCIAGFGNAQGIGRRDLHDADRERLVASPLASLASLVASMAPPLMSC
jgi:hypothetical protein